MDTSIRVDDLKLSSSKKFDPKLARTLVASINEADADGDGNLTVEELLDVFSNSVSQTKKAKRRGRMVIVLSLVLLLVLAANAGLTTAVVLLAKDSSVTNNVMVAKGSNSPVATATAFTSFALKGGVQGVLQQKEQLAELETIAFDVVGDTHTARVCATSANPSRQSVLVYTCTGAILALTPNSPSFQLMTLEQVLDADLTSAPLAPLPPSGNATLGGEGSPAARRLLNFYSISEPVVSGPIRRW